MNADLTRRDLLIAGSAIGGGIVALTAPSGLRRRLWPLPPSRKRAVSPQPTSGKTIFGSDSTPARSAGRNCPSSRKSRLPPKPATRLWSPGSTSWSVMPRGVARLTTSPSASAMRGYPSRAQSGLSNGSSTTRTGARGARGGQAGHGPRSPSWRQTSRRAARAANRSAALRSLPDRRAVPGILELGDQIGVVPEAEIWGPSKTLSRLGEAAFVAIEAHHPKACILPDVYHLYRGGSDFGSIGLLGPKSFFVLHCNDYPAQPPRSQLTDADRVYPGDGAAPLGELLSALSRGGFTVTLSLELFNRKLWAQDPLEVARTGLEKMKSLFWNDRTKPA